MYCKIDFFNSNKNLCDLILAGATPLSADFWLLGGGGGGGGGGGLLLKESICSLGEANSVL